MDQPKPAFIYWGAPLDHKGTKPALIRIGGNGKHINRDYNVDEYATDFFIFGSNGGGAAYAVKKSASDIYEIPFIGMSNEEAVFKNKTFSEFIAGLT